MIPRTLLAMDCVSCQTDVDDDASFCSNCGHEMARRFDERRVVTVLFADIVGFTGLSEARDPEQVKILVDRCFALLADDITAFGSRVDKVVGDAIVALFDFMLLERPIVYYVPGMQSFTGHRSLMYQLEEVAVGPMCTNEDELARALTAARLDGIGDHRDRYHELRQRFHTYPPGGASARAVDAIEQEFLGVGRNGRAPQQVG
jgi:class 3 adenylate cyclase